MTDNDILLVQDHDEYNNWELGINIKKAWIYENV